MKIGIIGAENTHTAHIAKVLNVDKSVEGFSVEFVWGETREFAEKAAEFGQIPNIVEDPSEMLGKIDALIVDHRDPKYHLEAALPFIKAGIPAFIDKPFCVSPEEGQAFLDVAKEKGTPVTSFSVLTHQKTFAEFKEKMAGAGEVLMGETWGMCDLNSPWSGIYFYGIHQVDMILHAFGFDIEKVLVKNNGTEHATGQLFYPNGTIVTMHLIKDWAPSFGIGVIGKKGVIHQVVKMDENPYTEGVRIFTDMFKTGELPKTDDEILVPVKVLEALQRSVQSGAFENVESGM
ncbi:MAG: Gfo/Idh/MocA family oxidoreductase [Verrucomicrobiota bacterium]